MAGELSFELMALLWHLTNGRLSGQEQDRLDKMLADSREARATYLQVMHQMASLSWQRTIDRQERALAELIATQQHDTSPVKKSQRHPGSIAPVAAPEANVAKTPSNRTPLLGFLTADLSWVRTSSRVLGMALGGLLLGYFVVMFALIPLARRAESHRARQAPGAADVAAQRRTIGKLSSEANARWTPGKTAPIDNVARIGERCGLNSGRATIRLSRGACLVIDGPARWQFESENRLQLDEGCVAAHVPPAAIGFAVVTPCAEVVDLGTDFGVEVAGDGKTEVHVVRGKVAVRPAGNRKPGLNRGIELTKGEAVRVTVNSGTSGVTFNAARFSEALAIAALPEAGNPEAVSTIWLGNLFDDRPGTPLADAMRTDTYRATPTFNNTLGICRLFYSGEMLKEIAPGIRFDLNCVEWRSGMLFSMANDAWADRNLAEPSGGLRLSGVQMPFNGPKVEEGIGMFGNSLVTFDLDELRAAGSMPGRPLKFVCDAAGINDGGINSHGLGSIHLTALVSTAEGVRLALVDGAEMPVVRENGNWKIDAPLGKPLVPGGPYVSFQAHLGPTDKYLTLISSSTQDGDAFDHGTWIRARLEVVPP